MASAVLAHAGANSFAQCNINLNKFGADPPLCDSNRTYIGWYFHNTWRRNSGVGNYHAKDRLQLSSCGLETPSPELFYPFPPIRAL
jgi:hypothetical protein